MSDWVLQRYVFLARLRDQPPRHAYCIGQHVLQAMEERKHGRSLARYIAHAFRHRPSILAEWEAARADVRFLRQEQQARPHRQEMRLLLDMVYHRMYRRQVPLDYLLGWTPFLGLRLAVRPPILIPRPDTASWISCLLGRLQRTLPKEMLPEGTLPGRMLPERTSLCVCEVGTGSGAIAIAMAQALPHSQFTAIDVSSGALRIARQNARRNLANVRRIRFRRADLFAEGEGALLEAENFDLLVSNPPYIARCRMISRVAPSVRRWEASRALVGGTDRLGIAFHLRLLEVAARRGRGERALHPDIPILAMELDGSREQMTVVQEAAQRMPAFRRTEIIADERGLPRAIFCY